MYDTNGNLIKEVYTDSDGDKTVYDYTYDANGNLIKEVYTYSDGDKTVYDYMYDTNGNLIKEVKTYYDGDKTVYDYTYDANGNLVKKVRTDSDGWKEVHEYIYDASGYNVKVTSSFYDEEKFLGTDSTDLTYDAYGNLIKEVYINDDCSETISWEYKLVYASNYDADLIEDIIDEIEEIWW